jgi:hypothetical protein
MDELTKAGRAPKYEIKEIDGVRTYVAFPTKGIMKERTRSTASGIKVIKGSLSVEDQLTIPPPLDLKAGGRIDVLFSKAEDGEQKAKDYRKKLREEFGIDTDITTTTTDKGTFYQVSTRKRDKESQEIATAHAAARMATAFKEQATYEPADVQYRPPSAEMEPVSPAQAELGAKYRKSLTTEEPVMAGSVPRARSRHERQTAKVSSEFKEVEVKSATPSYRTAREAISPERAAAIKRGTEVITAKVEDLKVKDAVGVPKVKKEKKGKVASTPAEITAQEKEKGRRKAYRQVADKWRAAGEPMPEYDEDTDYAWALAEAKKAEARQHEEKMTKTKAQSAGKWAAEQAGQTVKGEEKKTAATKKAEKQVQEAWEKSGEKLKKFEEKLKKERYEKKFDTFTEAKAYSQKAKAGYVDEAGQKVAPAQESIIIRGRKGGFRVVSGSRESMTAPTTVKAALKAKEKGWIKEKGGIIALSLPKYKRVVDEATGEAKQMYVGERHIPIGYKPPKLGEKGYKAVYKKPLAEVRKLKRVARVTARHIARKIFRSRADFDLRRGKKLRIGEQPVVAHSISGVYTT